MNLFNLDARKCYRIGAETGASRENAEPFVSAEPWRSHGRTPCASDVLRENPYNPQVAKAFEAAQCICVAELRLETNGGTQVLHDSALTRNAKLFAEIAFDASDNFKRKLLHTKCHPALCCGGRFLLLMTLQIGQSSSLCPRALQ